MSEPPLLYRTRPREVPEAAPRDLAAELNPEQGAAATYATGPLLVVAGAGTGKTRTLVYRVAHLLGRGVPPDRILLLTFTRRAAQEMLSRAERLVGAASARDGQGVRTASMCSGSRSPRRCELASWRAASLELKAARHTPVCFSIPLTAYHRPR